MEATQQHQSAEPACPALMDKLQQKVPHQTYHPVLVSFMYKVIYTFL